MTLLHMAAFRGGAATLSYASGDGARLLMFRKYITAALLLLISISVFGADAVQKTWTISPVAGKRYSHNTSGTPTAPTPGTPTVNSSTAITVPISTACICDTLTPEYKTTAGSTWTTLSNISTSAANYQFTGLSASTSYDFRFVAGANAQSANSSTATASTGSGTSNSWPYAPFTMEIIQPLAGLNTHNYFYVAHPNVPYIRNAAVIGGAYPITYSLTTAPGWLSINSATGQLTGNSPADCGGPCNVTIHAVDSLGTAADVSYTITVDAANFLFIDAVNGNNANAGTYAAPWKDWWRMLSATQSDLLSSAIKDSTLNQYKHVILRAGTYYPDGYITPGNYYVEWSANWPQSFTAYPGESVTIEYGTAGHSTYNDSKAHYFRVLTSNPDFVLDGITHTNCNQRVNVDGEYYFCWRLVGSNSSNNVTLRGNTFDTMDGTGGGSNNQSMIMAAAGSSFGQYWAFIGNTFTNVENGYGVITYDLNKVLFERNLFTNFGTTHAIGPKVDTSNFFVRNNSFTTISWSAGWAYGALDTLGYYNHEYSYNLYKCTNSTTECFLVNNNANQTLDKVKIFRNTIVGTVTIYYPVSNFEFQRNAYVNAQSSEQGLTWNSGVKASSTYTVQDNLNVTTGDFDANGTLTGSYSAYENTHGRGNY